MNLTLNYTLSPYTGWTRAHWEHIFARLTYGYVLAAEKQGSYARALYRDDRRPMPDAVDGIESFARIASSWGAWLHNPRNPSVVEFNGRALDIAEILKGALLDGTNPDNPQTYWGDFEDMDQRIVESADIGLAIWFSRERVFNRMTASERAQIVRWLEQADDKETYYDNWILFPLLPMTARLLLGYPVDMQLLDARLDQMDAFYMGDGWYVDGPYSEYELYNAWMFGWHFILWAWMDGARRPEYSQRVLKRARSFLAGFQHFFGANGSYPAWGRSLVYRFSAVACFVTGYLMGLAPASPGGVRRILSGSLKYFYSHEFIHPTEHYIVQGYHGDMPYANEAYISPGSPEWACHAFAALMFDADDPLWTETEQPLPVERGDFELALPVPGLALSGNKSSGQVLLLNAGSGHLPENPRHHYVSKYGKLAYSTHFPFNVLPAPHSYAPDAMVALCDKEGVFSHRFMSRAYDVAPGMSWCEFVEVVDDDYQLLRVAIVVWRGLQVRLTRVLSSHRVRAFEAPGALGTTGAACVTRLSDLDEGWEYAEADGRALAIKRLWGYDAQQPSAPFLGYSNINLGYPYAEQPMVYERAPRLVTRNLAAATLLSPTPFNPSEAFAGVQVAANEQGAFYVSFRDGELAFVSLENVLPNKVRVGTLDVMGDGVRHVRVTAATKSVTALGADSIAGICALDRSGMLCLRRDDAGTVSITTDAGISLDSNWLNGDIAGVEVHDIDGAWSEITASCDENRIPHALVREWQKHNERTYIEFRVKVA